jgi:glucan phosphorylase
MSDNDLTRLIPQPWPLIVEQARWFVAMLNEPPRPALRLRAAARREREDRMRMSDEVQIDRWANEGGSVGRLTACSVTSKDVIPCPLHACALLWSENVFALRDGQQE